MHLNKEQTTVLIDLFKKQQEMENPALVILDILSNWAEKLGGLDATNSNRRAEKFVYNSMGILDALVDEDNSFRGVNSMFKVSEKQIQSSINLSADKIPILGGTTIKELVSHAGTYVTQHRMAYTGGHVTTIPTTLSYILNILHLISDLDKEMLQPVFLPAQSNAVCTSGIIIIPESMCSRGPGDYTTIPLLKSEMEEVKDPESDNTATYALGNPEVIRASVKEAIRSLINQVKDSKTEGDTNEFLLPYIGSELTDYLDNISLEDLSRLLTLINLTHQLPGSIFQLMTLTAAAVDKEDPTVKQNGTFHIGVCVLTAPVKPKGYHMLDPEGITDLGTIVFPENHSGIGELIREGMFTTSNSRFTIECSDGTSAELFQVDKLKIKPKPTKKSVQVETSSSLFWDIQNDTIRGLFGTKVFSEHPVYLMGIIYIATLQWLPKGKYYEFCYSDGNAFIIRRTK